MKQFQKIAYLLLILLFAISFKALAIDNDGLPGDDVPIDGGLSLLVAAGVGYGAKKIKQYRNKN